MNLLRGLWAADYDAACNALYTEAISLPEFVQELARLGFDESEAMNHAATIKEERNARGYE
jgi:hypothetical protein